MHTHLDELEHALDRSGGPWIVGEHFTLADVGMMVILETPARSGLARRVPGGAQTPCQSLLAGAPERAAQLSGRGDGVYSSYRDPGRRENRYTQNKRNLPFVTRLLGRCHWRKTHDDIQDSEPA